MRTVSLHTIFVWGEPNVNLCVRPHTPAPAMQPNQRRLCPRWSVRITLGWSNDAELTHPPNCSTDIFIKRDRSVGWRLRNAHTNSSVMPLATSSPGCTHSTTVAPAAVFPASTHDHSWCSLRVAINLVVTSEELTNDHLPKAFARLSGPGYFASDPAVHTFKWHISTIGLSWLTCTAR